MANTSVKFTYQDLLTAPDDRNRYEIFEGELIVTPSPVIKHQIAHGNLFNILFNYVKNHAKGRVLSAPTDIYFDEETVFKPDLLYVSKKRLNILEERRINGAPDLIVEILSPGTADRDRGFKFRRYEKEEVQEYWLVDPMEDTLEIYELQQKRYKLFGRFSESDEVSTPIFPNLSFPVSEVWE